MPVRLALPGPSRRRPEVQFMKARLSFVWGVLAALLIALPAEAQDYRDQQLALDISREINRYTRLTIFDDVSGRVDNGVVTLTGKVTMPFKRQDLGRRVGEVRGVREVLNQIDVLPVSTFDEELRYRIARAIYRNPSFWRYASMVNPPIHIIVEHGRVTLTGVVHSDVERALARSLATGWGELSVTNQLRTDAETNSQLRNSQPQDSSDSQVRSVWELRVWELGV
jgi:hyperosmotically inducible protein